MGGKVGFWGMKKAPIRQVGAYERLSAAGEFRSLALILSTHSAGIRIVTYGPGGIGAALTFGHKKRHLTNPCLRCILVLSY